MKKYVNWPFLAGRSSNGARSGQVFLVGAGPGDPELITVRALNLLRRADIVVYDSLVNPALLEETRPGSQLIFAGKRAGTHSTGFGANAFLDK